MASDFLRKASQTGPVAIDIKDGYGYWTEGRKKLHVSLRKLTSDPQNINQFPSRILLSPLPFSQYVQSVKLLKFSDDTALTGFIFDGDESTFR